MGTGLVKIFGIFPKKNLLMQIDPHDIFLREMQKNREKKIPPHCPGFPGKKIGREYNNSSCVPHGHNH